MAHGSVATVANAQKSYQSGIQNGAGKWAANIGSYSGDSPMALAAAQVEKAKTNYNAVLSNTGPNGWVAQLQAVPVAYWKSQAAASQQKYAMAKGATRWAKWYQNEGQNIAVEMQNIGRNGRAQGVPGIQRCVDALTAAQAMGRKGGGH